MGLSNLLVLDKRDLREVALEILSFSGGENQISESHVMKVNEARIIENWDANSLGGMVRSNGFNEVADGGAGYTLAADMLAQHKDTGGSQIYAIYEGDLVYKNAATFTNDDNGAFTSGILSSAISMPGNFLWITNTSDNLKKKAVGVAIAIPASVPATACARIGIHKNRMVAEGSVSAFNRIYGSRTGVGNWSAADAWSLSNDAWSIDLPNDTRGFVPNFPSGNEILVFTEGNCYALSNFPNTAFRPVSTPGRGCGAPYSIALGDEGVYFVSRRPTLGVYLYDGSSFTELTQYNHTVFTDIMDFSKRIYGIYRNRKYYLLYNEVGSGVSYPNRMRVYDARFSRWMNRIVNPALLDNFGYPAVLQYSSNELYVASSQKDKLYELETTDNSDELLPTLATYSTKVFTSNDFAQGSGGPFPIDNVKLKLTKLTITYSGTIGTLGFNWESDRGRHSGSKTIDMTANGAMLNTTFILNQSFLSSPPPDRTKTIPFPNNAVGYSFQFQITNSGTSTLVRVKKIKISAVAINEQ